MSKNRSHANENMSFCHLCVMYASPDAKWTLGMTKCLQETSKQHLRFEGLMTNWIISKIGFIKIGGYET